VSASDNKQTGTGEEQQGGAQQLAFVSAKAADYAKSDRYRGEDGYDEQDEHG